MNRMMVGLAGAAVLAAGVAACGDGTMAPALGPVTRGPVAAAVPDESYHFVGDREYGYADWVATDGPDSVWGAVDVWRSDSSAVRRVGLSYFVTRCDPAHHCTTEYAYGDIPAGDLRGDAAGGLHLETNTAANPDLERSGPGGLLVVDWRRTGDWRQTFSGNDIHRTPAFTQHMRGMWTFGSAVASGQVLGIPFETVGYAELGSNHRVEIVIVRDATAVAIPVTGSGSPADAGLGASGSTAQFHFVADGDGAQLRWSSEDGDGSTSGYVYVTRGSRQPRERGAGPGEQTTWVNYEIIRCDQPDDCRSEEGYGVIPESDLTGDGQGWLHLRTNTAGLPDFYNSGPGGAIEVDWKRTALWWDFRTGSSTLQTRTYTERSHGSITTVSATASGQLLGVPIPPGADADLRTHHSVTITIDRRR